MSGRLDALNLELVSASRVVAAGAEWALAAGARLAVSVLDERTRVLDDLEGETLDHQHGPVLVGPMSPRNAAALRRHLPWLQPCTVGTRTSAGLGDRLGLATPGHVRAVRTVGGGIAPVFAQQSIREMTRTGRTPAQVMDDATWGMFAEGW
ncbi:MAG TPA: tagaturonate epimerase family protein, partial [Vicinamibacteria bacterium]|nr:tagaturonate epimerase family protein [Vicinamibacteria bacterium]